jgi:hypothetical protein
MAARCSAWTQERRPSGSAPHVLRCHGGRRAEIVSGDGYYTYNLYRGGRWIVRGSAKTLRAAKSTAARRLMR